MIRNISFICIYDRLFIITVTKLHILQFCGKCSMTAVIGPVGIQYTNLRHGRISLFFLFKVILDMLEIFEGHSQIQRTVKFMKSVFRHFVKSFKNADIRRIFELCHQSLWFFHTSFPGIHRVDAVALNRLKLRIIYLSFNHISGCGTDNWLLIFFQELYTLYGRICSLVKLPRQILYGKYLCTFRHREFFFI